MSIRRLRSVSTPVPAHTQAQAQAQAQAQRITTSDADEDAILAHWLAETARARADPSGRRMWQIHDSPYFAELWYAARDAGERVRAQALNTLYNCHFTDDTAPRDDGQSAPQNITAKLRHTGTEQTGVRVTLL